MSHPAFDDWDKAVEHREANAHRDRFKLTGKSAAELKAERHAKRQLELPAAKASVTNSIERVMYGARLTDLERQLFGVALAAVKAAR